MPLFYTVILKNYCLVFAIVDYQLANIVCPDYLSKFDNLVICGFTNILNVKYFIVNL